AGWVFRNSIVALLCWRGRSTCAASPPTSPIRLARPRPSRERVSSAIAANSLGFTYATPEFEIRLCWSDRRVGKGALAPCPPQSNRETKLVGTLRFAHPTDPTAQRCG